MRRLADRPRIGLGLAAIALVVLVFGVATTILQNSVRNEVLTITKNALASVRAVDRMRLALVQESVLLQAHVHTKDPDQMAALERQLAASATDFQTTAERYDPMTTFPGEQPKWQRFRQGEGALRARYPDLLEASRRNRDVESQAALDRLWPLFQEVEHTGEQLAQINEDAADQAATNIVHLRRVSDGIVLGLALAVIVTCLAIGASVLSLIRQGDRSAHAVAVLEDKNRELDAFAGRVAHDLRGPLTTLNLAASSLVRRAPQAESTAWAITRAVERLDLIVRDLLALSRLGSRGELGTSDPEAVATQLRSELLPRFESASGTLHVAVEPGRVACGEGLLRQALWNVTDNALTYGRPGVPVTVELSGHATTGMYELRISDNGAGMSEQDVGQIFKAFFRGAGAQEKPGTGLGLSIVKRVVDAAGGSISVTSELGKGTTFILRLPTATGSRAGNAAPVREGPVAGE